jgi:hypothetical protein
MTRATAILMLSCLLSGCMPQPMITPEGTNVETGISRLYKADFQGFVAPDAASIKSGGEHRTYPYVSFDRVWDAAVWTFMQESVILYAAKSQNSGILATFSGPPMVTATHEWSTRKYGKQVFNETRARPPLAVLIEEDTTGVSLYLYWMKDLYVGTSGQKPTTVTFPEDRLKQEFKGILDRLTTQVYAGQRTTWKYLHIGDRLPGGTQ